jgi:hypothetical protein
MTYSTFSHLTGFDRELVEAHVAKALPRYSISQWLRGGAYVRRWTSDRQAALAQHADAVSDPDMDHVISFDHLAVLDLAVTFSSTNKTRAQLTAESDAAIDRMIERWLDAAAA